MSEPALLTILRGIGFLKSVAQPELSQLAAIAQAQTLPAGAVIFREGERGNKFYLIVDGSVSLELASPGATGRRVHTVGCGELLAWSPLVDTGAMKATGRTLKETKLLSFDAAQTMELCDKATGLGYALARQIARALAERLHATRLYLLEVCHHELPDVVPFGVHEGAD